MDIIAELIAAAMGKGWDDKLEHCRSYVRSTVADHSNTDVITPVTWLWCHSSVRQL